MEIENANSTFIMNKTDSEYRYSLSGNGSNNVDEMAIQMYEFIGYFVQV